MSIKYKIIETNPAEHSIIVRFYSDNLTENMLAIDWGNQGQVTWCRTDYSITLWDVPAPTGEKLHELIMRNAPKAFFELHDKISDPNIDTSLTSVTGLIGIQNIATEKPVPGPLQKVVEGTPIFDPVNLTSNQVWNLVDLTGEDIAQIEQARVDALWQGAYKVEYAAISGSAVGLIAMGVMQGKPKCLAVQNWLKTLWAEYYARKFSTSTDYDFSAYATCPHSVPELMQELGV